MASKKKTTSKSIRNGTRLTVKKGTPQEKVLRIVVKALTESKANGKSYFSKTVVVREEETGKVYLGKAFADRIGLYAETIHLPLVTKTTVGKVAKSK